ERTRQADLERFRSLAREFAEAHGDGATVGAFMAELPSRFSTEESGRGVQLLTYPRAKGLEFDVVFLPRVLDGELPYHSGRSVADPQEERRLFYVGITRARHWLAITWPTEGVPPYVVFHDKTLVAIAAAKPSTPGALREIAGVGPTKVERYGDELLDV